MKQFMLAVATSVGLGAGSAYAVHDLVSGPQIAMLDSENEIAARTPRRLIIGLDISKSNPLIENGDFATKVAARIGREIEHMGFRSEVHVRTFGSYDAGQNDFYYDVVLSTRNRPAVVADEIHRLIASTPALVKSGKWHAQNYTNILAFLDNMQRSVGCAGMPTTIMLASDGIEDSQLASLDSRTGHLPDPEGRQYVACAELQILGIGEGTRSPVRTAHLRSEWTRWAKEAGFQKFQGLNDW